MYLNKKSFKQVMFLIFFLSFMVWLIFNYMIVVKAICLLVKLLNPLILGIIIAFIINIPMKKIENKVFKIKKRNHKKMIRILSLLISVILILGILGFVMFLIIPELIEAFENIAKNIPQTIGFISDIVDKANFLSSDIKNYIQNAEIEKLMDIFNLSTENIISFLALFLKTTISRLVTTFLGFIISLYILLDKENLIRRLKKVLKAFFKDEINKKIINVIKLINVTFTNFLTGQCLDACLTGFLLFVILSIAKLPYALILGVLFSITALIPYIGPFITLVIGIILIGVVKPIGALWYILIFFMLQQFDDNFTYPKIVGSSVGLPPLFAILSVLIGGSIFGFIGMLISIPASSVIYFLLKEFINKKIEEKN